MYGSTTLSRSADAAVAGREAARLRAMKPAPDLLDAFADAVAWRGDHRAIESVEGDFDYATLDRRITQLAHRLRALGVGPESRVGISLPRGARELMTMLAVLRAGGAYVPLVPSHPLDRLRAIVDDAAPHLVVVHPRSQLRELPDIQVLVLDDLDEAVEGWPTTPLEISVDPAQLAYLMFTSGSTGRPKGVEITRGAFASFLRSMAHTPGLSARDRLLAITTTGFDIAGLELFGPLSVGATVAIADYETARDPRLLCRMLEQGAFTIMQATPSMWRLLLEAGWRGDGRLRMLCGGEALPPVLAQRLLAAGGELWNMYGPTETTVWSSLERVVPGFERITIGQPIDATRLYVLDEHGVPTEASEGEVGIGGIGVARGYRGQPELTAQRFVAHPNGSDRIYRTGDLGRRLTDGRFEWLGRLDHQVKIRGNRVELGEIETVLRAVPGVSEALVVADRSGGDEPRLVAYWVGTARREALVEATRRELPATMVPSGWVALESFPLNSNGKIDRKQLPSPEPTLEVEAPHRDMSDTEACIAAVWRDVLGLTDVPVDEDFFSLGGTSVLATQVILRLEQQLALDISLRTFFETRTVEKLAACVGDDAARGGPVVVWLRHGRSDRSPLFCLFGLNVYQELANALGGSRHVIGTHVPFRYAPGRDPRPALAEIGQRYVSLIRSHQPHGPYELLGLCFGGIVAYEVARQLEAAGEQVATVAVIDAVLPNAIHVDTAKRARAALGSMRRAWREPGELGRWLRRGGDALAVHIPGLAPLLAGHPDESTPIDLPIDGPEVELEMRRFADARTRLDARLLLVRATAERQPAWMTLSPDYGWGGRAARLDVHDIAADHLGVLRAPHVASLARALYEVG
jgi:amino acid adenylation domain-containing protein